MLSSAKPLFILAIRPLKKKQNLQYTIRQYNAKAKKIVDGFSFKRICYNEYLSLNKSLSYNHEW
jgi:hypothetical protein